MRIFVEMHAQKKFWSNKTTTKLIQSKEQNWDVAKIWSLWTTTLKLGETRRRKAKALECEWRRVNPNAKELNPTRVGRGTCMGHGVHGIVGTMDPHVDGHVMAGYENFVTWVHFASRAVRGMLQERGWRWGGWAGGEGGWGEGKTCPGKYFCTRRIHFPMDTCRMWNIERFWKCSL